MCIFCRMRCTDRMENQAAGEKITVNEHDSNFLYPCFSRRYLLINLNGVCCVHYTMTWCELKLEYA